MASLLGRCLWVGWWAQLGALALSIASLGVDERAGARCVPVLAPNCTIGPADQDGRWSLLGAVLLQALLVLVPCLMFCRARCRGGARLGADADAGYGTGYATNKPRPSAHSDGLDYGDGPAPRRVPRVGSAGAANGEPKPIDI